MVFSVCGCESTLLEMKRTGQNRHGRLIGWYTLAYSFGYALGLDWTGFGSDWPDWRDGCL